MYNQNAKMDALEAVYYAAEAELQCFWTGNVPENATLSQMILAQWGRKRLEEMKSKED